MKIKYILAGMVLVFLVYCKSNKSSATVAAYAPTDKQMEIAQKRWANTLAEELKDGRNIYVTKCTECHKAHTIERFSEKKWLHEIDDMSPKAKLTSEEKLKLTKYVLSYREENAPVKAN
jgi:cytochrome c5